VSIVRAQGIHWCQLKEKTSTEELSGRYHALHSNALQEALPSLSHKHETKSHLRHSKPETWNEFLQDFGFKLTSMQGIAPLQA
jgi:hypothetical protein